MAWSPDSELSHPEWLALGRRIGSIGRCSQWWVGDWVCYGADRWGEKYAEAGRITGYDVKSLRNMAYVSSRFELSRRRDNLTWSHHAALAALDPVEQDDWLDRSIADRLAVADLRIELRAAQRLASAPGGAGSETGPGVQATVLCPHCGHAIQLARGGVGAGGMGARTAASASRDSTVS